jgi:hypothetical protein
MWGRLLLFLLVAIGVWYYFNQKKAPEPQAAPAGATAGNTTASSDCFLFAERANAALVAASALAARPPVDANDWSRTESSASSAISTAESVCGGSNDARQALSLMRVSLSELGRVVHGDGGVTGLAARQGEIYDLLNGVRGR